MKNKIRKTALSMMAISLLLVGCGNDKKIEVESNPSIIEETETQEQFNGKTTEQNEINFETENNNNEKIDFFLVKGSSKNNVKNGTPKQGDSVIIDNYRYTYNIILENEQVEIPSDMNGWSVYVVDKNIADISKIKSELFGIPVKSMNYCFSGCQNITETPEFPMFLKTAKSAFSHCTNLKSAKPLPNTLIDTREMFDCCLNLEKMLNFPENVKYVDKMYNMCKNINGEVNLPIFIETSENVFNNTEKPIIVHGEENNILHGWLSQYGNVYRDFNEIVLEITEEIQE